MKKTLIPAALVAFSQLATAQEITPKWFQHINETVNVAPADKLPILVKKGAAATAFDGNSAMDGYSQLIRYDANRLILGVRENGIDEANASAAEKAVAEAYPDRSLVWIDANTGKPLGVAFKEAIFPADAIGYDVTQPDKGNQTGKGQAFWRFGIEEGPEGTRAIYTAYKHLILRYAQKADGTWETKPTIAYEEQLPGIGDGLSGTASDSGEAGSWRGWRWRNFRVKGGGTNTVIIAGGGTWRIGMHPQMLVTTDGKTFKPAGRVNDRDGGRRNAFSLGGTSSAVATYGLDPWRPKLQTIYSSHYPGTGYETRPDRYLSDPDKPAPSPEYNQQPDVRMFNIDNKSFGALPAFSWEAAGKDGRPLNHEMDGVHHYDGNWTGALGADSKLNYIVAYSMPSWNNVIPGGIKKPAWLAIHRLDGSIASGKSSLKLNFTEADEIVESQPTTGHDFLYDPNVEVYPDATAPANLGKSEILVTFGSTGFGVFTAQNVAASLVSSPASQTAAAGSSVTLTADVTGSPNDFQWYRNGVPLPKASYYQGANKAVLTITGVTQSDAGDYQLRWTNPISGAGQTAVAKLTVTGSFVRWADSRDIAKEAPAAPGEVITNANSFTIRASGGAAFDKVDAVGDTGFFRWENVTGDFDKVVRLVSLKAEPSAEPAAAATRASLMVRASTAADSPSLELMAFDPKGANLVRVGGRGRVNQVYSSALSRDYPGVAANIPNQWLRIRRVGNAFSFFVSKNGTEWSLVAEQYQSFADSVLVGTYAAPDDVNLGTQAVAEFANYGDYVSTDKVAPTVVSAGTIDKRLVGVKFSEAVNAISASKASNYSISQGQVVSAQTGIGGNTVYLAVAGLTSDTFTVTVNNVVDAAGNPVASNSSVSGKKSNWTSTDIGYIQKPGDRPTPGDDPYVIGQAVAISSETNPEFEIIGGGSNAYNPGDFMHYLYREYTGDFDVVVAVNRFDKRGYAGGYANGGIHVRKGLYRADNNEPGNSTKVPAFVNITYYERSAPDRAAIQLNRPNAGDNYGNNAPNGNNEEVGGLLGFFTGLSAIDAAGTPSPQSSPTQAKWLRVKRVGDQFTALFSYDGVTWKEQSQPGLPMPNLVGPVLVGFGHHNDVGFGAPPNNAYAGTGTIITTPEGTEVASLNESSYGVVRISHLGDFATAFEVPAPTLAAVRNANGSIAISWSGSGFTLQSATSVTGPFTTAAGAPTVNGNQSTVTVTPSDSQRYYRLVR